MGLVTAASMLPLGLLLHSLATALNRLQYFVLPEGCVRPFITQDTCAYNFIACIHAALLCSKTPHAEESSDSPVAKLEHMKLPIVRRFIKLFQQLQLRPCDTDKHASVASNPFELSSGRGHGAMLGRRQRGLRLSVSLPSFALGRRRQKDRRHRSRWSRDRRMQIRMVPHSNRASCVTRRYRRN